MTRSNNLTNDARQTPDRQDARTIERSIGIEARPDTVWAILSQPDGFSRWMDGAAAFEARAGSPFRVDFPNFGVVKAGEVAAFDAEAMHLAVTWGSEEGPQAQTVPAGSTLVEFRVRETADGCQVDLRHGGFSSDTAAAEHDAGWRFHLGRLELMANRADLSAGLERTLKRWFEAWNEADPDNRLAALPGVLLRRRGVPRRMGGRPGRREPEPPYRQLPSLHARMADRGGGRAPRLPGRGAGRLALDGTQRNRRRVQPRAGRLRRQDAQGGWLQQLKAWAEPFSRLLPPRRTRQASPRLPGR